MSDGTVLVMIRLIAGLYQVDPALMQCIVYNESSYNVAAQNGIHTGLCQYNPDTWGWFVGMALADPLFMHAQVILEHPSQDDPISALSVMAWALKNGLGAHWSTWSACKGEAG